MTVVLDSWAVLRYLEDDGSAAEAVADLLERDRPLMAWINLGEVHYVLRRLRGEDDAIETVRDLRDVIDVRLPDERLVLDAARIKADHPMAYADAVAAALAVTRRRALDRGSRAADRPRRLALARPAGFDHLTVGRSAPGGSTSRSSATGIVLQEA